MSIGIKGLLVYKLNTKGFLLNIKRSIEDERNLIASDGFSFKNDRVSIQHKRISIDFF